jgi:hypothetical protein
MKLTALVLAFFAFSAFDCRKPTANTEPKYIERMPVQSVTMPERISLGQELRYSVVVETPTPCWTFRTIKTSKEGREYRVEVYAQYHGEPCIQVISSFEASGSIRPTERGTYAIVFWRGEGEGMRKTFVVE